MSNARSGIFSALMGLALLSCGAGSAIAQACIPTSVSNFSLQNANLLQYHAATGTTRSRTATFRVNKTGGNTGCPSVQVAFRRNALPATMAGPSSSVLRYDLQTTGGSSVLYTGGIPAVTISGAPATVTTNYYTVSITYDITAAAQQIQLANGAYADAIDPVVTVFYGGATLAGPQPPLAVTANVNNPRSCTIGGTTTPGSGSATVPISNGRVSSTAPIAPTLPSGNVVSCTGNAIINLDLQSQNGRLTGPSNSNPAFANTINYTATANVAGGTAATFSSTTGTAVQGTAGTNTGGTMSISITPIDPGKPLIAGTYNDVLRLIITPQN